MSVRLPTDRHSDDGLNPQDEGGRENLAGCLKHRIARKPVGQILEIRDREKAPEAQKKTGRALRDPSFRSTQCADRILSEAGLFAGFLFFAQSFAENIAERCTAVCRTVIRHCFFLVSDFKSLDREADFAGFGIDRGNTCVDFFTNCKAFRTLF